MVGVDAAGGMMGRRDAVRRPVRKPAQLAQTGRHRPNP